MQVITKTLTVRQWRLITIGLALANGRNGFAATVTKEEIRELAMEIANETGAFDREGEPLKS